MLPVKEKVLVYSASVYPKSDINTNKSVIKQLLNSVLVGYRSGIIKAIHSLCYLDNTNLAIPQ